MADEKGFISAEVPRELLDDLNRATAEHARRTGVTPKKARSAVIRMALIDALPRLFGDAQPQPDAAVSQ